MTQRRLYAANDQQSRNAHYLQLALNRLRLLLKRRVLWLKSQWQHDPATEAGRRVITDPHVAWLLRSADPAAEQQFYTADPAASALTAAANAAKQELATYRSMEQQRSLPIAVLAHLFGLGEFEEEVLLLCLAPELDPAISALYAYVQDNVNHTYPTMHLAYALFGSPQHLPWHFAPALSAEAPLRRYQLITLRDEAQPLTAQPLGLPERILDYLRGANYPDATLKLHLDPVQCTASTTGLSQCSQEVVTVVQAARRDGPFPVVTLIGPKDGGQRTVAASVSEALNVHLCAVALNGLSEARLEPSALCALLEREALLLQCAYFIDLTQRDELVESQRQLIRSLEQQTKVLIFVAHQERLESGGRLVNVTLPPFTSEERQSLWQQTLPNQESGDQDDAIDVSALVQQFRFGPQGVQQTVAAARHRAVMHGQGASLTQADLWEACREQAQWQLDDLAQRIEPAYGWDDLVLPPDLEAQLHEIAAQVRYRHRVYGTWGYERVLNRGRGISALFAGASGTGKTMAAEVLANALNIPLYRIDLAGVVSKYVGETEKNLRWIFQAAEQSGTILFFDEADALFGKRTDVKDSHDRYANIEVNYLLQLMENYSGLAILATNRRQAIDRAFLRRLRFVIDFVFPNLDSRRRIWRRVFPPDVPTAGIDYNHLARLEITGGNIHSIALNAAFLAAADGEVVTMAHILAAARREYAKIEKLEPDQIFQVG